MDRFLARLIDGVGFGIVYGIIYGILGAIFLSGFYNSRGELFVFYLFLQVFSVAVYIGYNAWFESNKGATIGKQIMKLKVIGPDGESNPTLQQAAIRSSFQALGLISIVPIVGPFLGTIAFIGAVIFIAVTINNDTVSRQGWHDKLAGGTTVLKIG